MHYLGVMPAMLMKTPPSANDRLPQVRFGFGAGVDRRLHAPFEERFGFPLLEAWAMTETGAGAVVIANHEPRLIGSSCFGREGADALMQARGLVDVLVPRGSAQLIETVVTQSSVPVIETGAEVPLRFTPRLGRLGVVP